MINIAQLWTTIATQLYALLILTFLDLVLGVAMALVQRRFSWAYLTAYIPNNVMPILGWLAVTVIVALPAASLPSVVSQALSTISGVVVYATVFLKILASILGHLSAMGVLTHTLNKAGVKPTGAR